MVGEWPKEGHMMVREWAKDGCISFIGGDVGYGRLFNDEIMLGNHGHIRWWTDNDAISSVNFWIQAGALTSYNIS